MKINFMWDSKIKLIFYKTYIKLYAICSSKNFDTLGSETLIFIADFLKAFIFVSFLLYNSDIYPPGSATLSSKISG